MEMCRTGTLHGQEELHKRKKRSAAIWSVAYGVIKEPHDSEPQAGVAPLSHPPCHTPSTLPQCSPLSRQPKVHKLRVEEFGKRVTATPRGHIPIRKRSCPGQGGVPDYSSVEIFCFHKWLLSVLCQPPALQLYKGPSSHDGVVEVIVHSAPHNPQDQNKY